MLLIQEDMMKSVISTRSIAAWQPLLLVSALANLAFPAIAQTSADQKLTPVTVSASRFESPEAPIGATVITAEQIREAGIDNVNEAIRKIGGVYGRRSFIGTSDSSLDLRGFGGSSDQNVVVLVDGVRISENEGTPSLMSSIPIESVERIEIVRGGSSVLYGEGATSGTIQIITKRGVSGITRGSVVAEVGSNNAREMRASLAKGWDVFSIDAHLNTIHADNYRDNNELRQDNFNGGLQWAWQDARFGLRINSSRQNSRLPGSLSLTDYQNNPKQTTTPNDYGSFDVDRYTLFGEKRFGDLELAADLSQRIRSSEFFQFGSLSTYESKTTQFSPRLRYTTKGQDGFSNEFVIGLDFSRYNRVSDNTFSNADETQRSEAVYFRNELTWNDTRIAFGARHEKFEKMAIDQVLFSSNYQNSDSVNAWSLEASHDVQPLITVFAKAGRSYRIGNVDDNAGKSNSALLKPQLSDDLEIGTSLGDHRKKLTAKIFQHRLKDEIFYDPTVGPCFPGFGCSGANVNLDPTKREGIEIDANIRFLEEFALSLILQHVSAKFTDGPNAGKEMTLVPKNTANLRLNWVPGNGQSADIGLQWVDSQRFSGDFTNSCNAKIKSFATVDARYAIRLGAWEFVVSGANLTDKKYFSQAYGSCINDPSLGIYPDPGRSVKVSARMDF